MATEKTTGKTEAGATTGGAAAGAATGAVIGAVAGGPVGAAIGAAIGGPAGALAGKEAADYSGVEHEFRTHHQSSAHAKTHSWDEAGPAYRYGWEGSGDAAHRGKSYTEVQTHLKKGWTGKGKYEDYEPYVRAAWERHAQHAVDTGGKSVVPVVEEELQVGKRTVEKGGVRVETRVTETPVQQTVHLHEESVKVERHAVDRPARAGDIAFKEGTIELRETAEEAVVAKRARVVEEVVISKEGHDRAQTVHDTVRRTDVDVHKVDTPTKVVGQTFDIYNTDFNKHFTTKYASGGYTYDQYVPAYRYGYNLAGDERYQGNWSTVEPEAKRLWEQHNKGTWEEFKDAVHHAWDKVRGKA